MRKKNKGLSTAIAASMLLSIITLIYVAYLSYGVPGYCKEAEVRMINDFYEDMLGLASKSADVISLGLPGGTDFHNTYSYPAIPFFATPNYATVTSNTYDLTVTIDNIKSPDLSIPNTITLRGKGVLATLNLVYLPSITSYIELGIVATEKSHLGGTILSTNTIFLPFFSGNDISSTLSPISGGGKGILVQNNTAQNITIQITGSRIPSSVWNSIAASTGLYIQQTSNSTIVHIPPGQYYLKSGVASFITGSKNYTPTYLSPETPTSSRAPAPISVKVLDEFFNPVPATVRLSCLQQCEVRYIQCTTSNCSSITTNNTATLPMSTNPSAVVNPSYQGVTTVTVTLNRTTGSPYQLAFLVVK